ncbi:alginate lyase family protein [uncultured Agrobacterium sp.]|uniref:alginate lyase family protein n=1 Tax=uncultured Agrobacterium sp. TaxID=157277 RepID=UPI0025ED52FA|nr:alginate lyase family protein [uncultured Agrobacterium sp.]
MFIVKSAGLAFGVVSLLYAGHAVAADDCPKPAAPVVNVDLPSRYKDDDKSRSELDETLNAEVEKALAPIDAFIRDLASTANATTNEKKAKLAADCIFNNIAAWARAGALKNAETMNAHLALSSRIAGIAAAYARALTVQKPSAETEPLIDKWLVELAKMQVDYFNTEAPPMASRNNHRAWAGLAAAQVGAIANRQDLLDWGAQTNEMLICSANDDGSLPEEMKRKDKALHYQLHAVAPIVVTAQILAASIPGAPSVCQGKLDKIVDFTIAALTNPALVTDLADAKQSFQTRREKLRSFQVAWLEPYLYLQRDDKQALDLANSLRPLSNSFLGGNLTELYQDKK